MQNESFSILFLSYKLPLMFEYCVISLSCNAVSQLVKMCSSHFIFVYACNKQASRQSHVNLLEGTFANPLIDKYFVKLNKRLQQKQYFLFKFIKQEALKSEMKISKCCKALIFGLRQQ